MLKSITIELLSENNRIIGLFRSLLTVGSVTNGFNNDVLVVGNKKSSLFFSFKDITIKEVNIRHSDRMLQKRKLERTSGTTKVPRSDILVSISNGNGDEKIVNEKYIISSKKQAYSFLSFLYAKHSTQATNAKNLEINSDNYDIDIPYSIISRSEIEMDYRSKQDYKLETRTIPYTENIKKDINPSLINSENIMSFLDKIVRGYKYERDNWEQGYSCKLASSS